MRKRAITLILALLLCLSCALPASAASGSRFKDVPDNAWYAEAVNAMADGGVLNGKGDGIFDPDAPVTLAELSAIYCRLMGEEVEAKNGHWAGSALESTWLGGVRDFDEYGVQIGLKWINGTQFPYADSPAYRGDALTIFGYTTTFPFFSDVHADGWSETGSPIYNFDLNKIADRSDYYSICNHYGAYGEQYIDQGHFIAAACIDRAYLVKLTNGIDANYTCNALGTLTRAQLAQMCYNMGWISVGSINRS